MKEWSYLVTVRDEGTSLGQILKAAGFTKRQISRQKFLPGGITLDSQPGRVDMKVRAGQVIRLRFRECRPETESGEPVPPGAAASGAPAAHAPEILYEDDCLLILNKPSGLACHPCPGHDQDNLGDQVIRLLRDQGEELPIRLIGRLDKDTSGAVIFAKDPVSAARLWLQRQNGTFQKSYYASVHGHFTEKEGTISLPMEKEPGAGNRMRVGAGMPAVTHYRVLWETGKDAAAVAAVVCTLETGRTHQIRAHMAAIGHPVLGDRFYGVPDWASHLCLHAGTVLLVQPFTENKILVSCTPTALS